ncbi:MAG: 16S rRNA (cytosine(1402)-N(4))-methyltransferase RsmH [Candidatus Cloacimonetes bacterium]|nr:16S rRNA (cytosine(1402)-N(4))-methyltransferase RsmH [Candidatus Cloacimonadota bacterium]MBS3766653.1 16S rRNA (cytosine(1402)-N(4))-methyltransferase RsmH [Candidatus Cloacimonadota bacterium]
MKNRFHQPVMLDKSIELLNIKPGGIYVDATAGGGGHLNKLCNEQSDIKIFAMDRDEEAINAAKKRCKHFDNITYINKNFSYLTSALALNRITKIDGILFDLGMSTHQLQSNGRGFSYKKNEKLDMRMNQNSHLTAFKVVNYYKSDMLAKVLKEYSEDRAWKRIWKKILAAREEKEIKTTHDLKKLIESVISTKNKNKTLSRIFQALRIEVNQELDNLKKALEESIEVLDTKGRIVVISYHSLEDRIVKNFFVYQNKECVCPPKAPFCICDKEKKLEIITKKPLRPSEEEIAQNPASRSAKLRAGERY